MTQTFDPARHPGEGPVAQRLIETTDAAAGTDTDYTMSVGDTFSGSLDSLGDRDWVAISLTVGQTYTISLAGVGGGGGTLDDPYLRLYDSSGSLVTKDDGSGPVRDSQLTFTASASGTYYISAGAFGDVYAGTYTIGVTDDTPPPVPVPDDPPVTDDPRPVSGRAVGTLDELADFLTDGSWAGWGEQRHTFDTSSPNEITVDVTGLTADGRQLARWAMEAWELVADIEFVEVTSGEMITMDDKGRAAFASYTSRGSTTTKADVNVGTGWLAAYGTSIDSYSLQAYIHELGHALGLGHQGAYNGRADYGVHETFSNDSWQLSIMSYFDQSENTRTDASYATLPGPMMADILAIQNLYGASDVTNGATTWGVGSNLPGYLGDFFNDALSNSEYGGGPVAFTIFDNGGVDHINASNSTTDDRWDMREQHFSDVNGLIGNVGIAAGTAIEHLTTGSGNDTITGNDLDNGINSGDGDDTIDGGDGHDTLIGGVGNDTIDGGTGIDQARFGVAIDDVTVTKDGAVYTVVSAEGIDTVTNVEEFVFGDTTLTAAQMDELAATTARELVQLGGAGDDDLTGTDGADTIHGGAGDNTIDAGDGDNRIFSGRGNDDITSGDDNDTIVSGDDNDTITSGGGNDSIDGGAGMDRARFGAAIGDVTVTKDGDVYTIVSAEGTDTVTNVEAFVFDDTTLSAAQMDAIAGNTDQVLVGTDGDDTIVSGAGNDTVDAGNGDNLIDTRAGNDLINSGDGHDTILSGEDNDTIHSGAGHDSLDGGAGFDQARFGVAIDDVTVTKDGAVYTVVSAEGIDRVTNVEEFVFGDTTLSAAQMDELAATTAGELVQLGGAGDDGLTGTDGADTIHGGAGDNTIDAGDGDNRIFSGRGNDSITSGDDNDLITSGAGNDTISSGDGHDTIRSGDDNDTITSGGGNDSIDGGAGMDRARFGAAIGDVTVTKEGDVYTIVSAEGTDTVTNVEAFVFADTTLSAAQMDSVAATADQKLDIFSDDGDNTIFGGHGHDTILGGNGNNRIDSREGNDFIESYRGDDTINSGAGNDSINSGIDNDSINSGAGNDTIKAGDDDDWINAGDDNDLIFSGRGNDTIIPGAGNDSIDGGNDDGKVRGDGTDIDQVRFGVALGDATVTKRGAFYFIVSPEGTDVVTQVEEFVFGDTTLSAADMDAIAGTTARLLTGTDDNDTLFSGSGNDTIDAGGGNNLIHSRAGDDSITSGTGNDTVFSGRGNDTITSGDGDDTIRSGDGRDTILSGDDNDTVSSGAGDDSIDGGAGFDQARFGVAIDDVTVTKEGAVYTVVSAEGIDTVTNVEEFVFGDTTLSAAQMDELAATTARELVQLGGAGDDDLTGTDGADTIHGGAGDNTIDAGDGDNRIFSGRGNDDITSGDDNDTIVSGDGNDTISSGDGHDSISSGDDNDDIASGGGNDSIDGGAGMDRARFDAAIGDVTVTKEGDVYTVVSAEGTDTVTNVEAFVFADTTLSAAQMDAVAETANRRLDSFGDRGDNTLFGGHGHGHDTITSGNGDNRIYSGAGNDVINSNPGDDTINSGAGDDSINSGFDNDSINSGAGNDTINSGDHDDWINADDDNDLIISGRGNDTITTGDGNDSIWSGYGADEIRSGDGNNRIWSGDGADTITTGDGNNRIVSGYGFFVDDDDSITTGDGNDAIISGAGDDTITSGAGNDTINSGDGNDTITTGDGADTIWSGDGADSITTGDGNDTIISGTGDDTIRSGEGDDSILSGYGNDRIFGDAGADTFVFKRGYDRDEINDFEIGTDTLRLSGALTGGMTGGADIISTYATLTNGAVVFDFGEGDIITISNLASLTGLSADIEIF